MALMLALLRQRKPLAPPGLSRSVGKWVGLAIWTLQRSKSLGAPDARESCRCGNKKLRCVKLKASSNEQTLTAIHCCVGGADSTNFSPTCKIAANSTSFFLTHFKSSFPASRAAVLVLLLLSGPPTLDFRALPHLLHLRTSCLHHHPSSPARSGYIHLPRMHRN